MTTSNSVAQSSNPRRRHKAAVAVAFGLGFVSAIALQGIVAAATTSTVNNTRPLAAAHVASIDPIVAAAPECVHDLESVIFHFPVVGDLSAGLGFVEFDQEAAKGSSMLAFGSPAPTRCALSVVRQASTP